MAAFKFKEEALLELKKSFGNDELETISILLEGKTKYNSIKKKHLDTFRKLIESLSNRLNWSDIEVTDKVTTIDEETLESQNHVPEITTVQKKEETCKYFKSAKCQYGRFGNKPDQQGKICSYSHPPICKNHEQSGKCFDNRCKKTHFNLCRDYMKTLDCKYKDKCRFFHPKKLRDYKKEQARNEYYASQESQIKDPNLAQNQEQITAQGVFLEFMKSQKEILWRLNQLEIQSKSNVLKW